MGPNLQETADLVTFTGEIFNGKRNFLYSVKGVPMHDFQRENHDLLIV